MARGLIGKGTLLQYSAVSASGPWTTIGGIGDMTGLESSVVSAAFAYQDMPTIDKPKVFGTAETSDLAAPIVYEQGGTQYAWLMTNRGVSMWFQRVTLDGRTSVWNGAITKVGDEVPIDKEITCPISIGVNGAITVTPASGSLVQSGFYTVTVGGGGTATIDLTQCGPTSSVSFAGLKITSFQAMAASGNAAAITVATASSYGYTIGGESFTRTLKAGDPIVLGASTTTGTVVGAGSTVGLYDLTVTGTAGDKLLVSISGQ